MSKEIIPIERVVQSIRWTPGQKVLLDSDLAALYGVTTGNLNKAVSRNRDRFPSDFMFQLSAEEADGLIFQIGRSRGVVAGEIGFHVREKAARYRIRKRA
jgi:ORF6N domain